MRRIKTVFRDRNKPQASSFLPEGQLGREAGTASSSRNLDRSWSFPSFSESGNASAFPDGIKVWHECPDALVDICFVHGLTGNRDTTWTAHGQPTPWPKTLLPSQLPRARLLTYGYDAYVVRASGVSANKLLDHATNLLIDLTNDRTRVDASTRPLVFVTHSLGGLVCKEAILLSRTHHDAHLRAIFDHVIGVMFMGTPHKGSWMADWARFPASALGLMKSSNRKLLTVLETDSQLLESIQSRFLSMVRDVREHGRCLHVTCFFEELPLTGVGRVVSKESATLDGYTAISIHSNHRDMVRFLSDDDTGFQRVLGELRRWIDLSASGAESPATTTTQTSVMVSSGSNPGSVQKACYYIPFPKNKRFVGRESTLKRLQDMLFAQDCQKAAIVGLGGIGKTQVALQLAYWVKEHRPEYDIFWVPALSTATFEEAYVEIARRLALQKYSDDDDPKDLVRDHLSSDGAGRWLLIIDNADDGDVLFTQNGLSRYLPESENGLTLFTTRSREVAVETVGSDVVDLSKMDWAEAMSFLEKSLIRKDLIHGTAVKELLEEMSYLPLGIAQAAAYLNKNQISITEYLRLLRSAEENMVSLLSREFRDMTRYADSQNSVAATWLVSFEQILKSDPFAGDLLSFISCIEPKAIPLWMLPKAQVEEHMTRAIGLLCGYAFLNRRGDTDVFDVHSLVHKAINVWLERHQRAQKAQLLSISHLTAISPLDKKKNCQLWRSLLPHALRVLDRSQECRTRDECLLSHYVGSFLHWEFRYKDSLLFHSRACRWAEEHLAEEDTKRLRMENHLAVAYSTNSQVKTAISMLERIMAIQEQTQTVSKIDHSLTGVDCDLALAYLLDGQLKKGIGMLENIVATQKVTLPEDDRDLLDSEHHLALAYCMNKQFKDAIQILSHITAIQAAMFPEDDTDRLGSQFNLAYAYEGAGEISKAEELLDKVVAIEARILPDDNIQRLNSMRYLAHLYQRDRQSEKAIELLEFILPFEERIFREEHSRTLTTQHNLAYAYADTGQISKARHLLEKVVAVKERIWQTTTQTY